MVYVSASSGSTGVPTLSPFTAEDFELFQDVQARLFWAAGLRPEDRNVHALEAARAAGIDPARDLPLSRIVAKDRVTGHNPVAALSGGFYFRRLRTPPKAT